MDLVNRSGLPLEVTTALDKSGREHLVVSQAAWTAQRAVRWYERALARLEGTWAGHGVGGAAPHVR